MATASEPADRIWPVVAAGAVVVAATTPVNLLLLWLCRGLSGGIAGRNLSGGPVLLGGVVNVGLFLALCCLTILVCHRASVFWRRVAVVAALVLHLGLWLGGSALLHAALVATDYVAEPDLPRIQTTTDLPRLGPAA